MKKSIKSFSIVLGVIGIVVSVVIGVATVFPNWESHAEFKLTFAKNVSEKISSYQACKADELMVVQTSGSSSCRYTIYFQKRSQSSYTQVVQGLTFKNNDEWDGNTYSLTSCWWNDVRFKTKKTAGTSTKSELAFSLGQTSD